MEGAIMTVTFNRFDPADHLSDEADISAYLDAASEYEDPALMVAALSTVARARNMSALARDADLTREGLRKALSADGNPSFATVFRLARAVGFRLVLRPLEP
jgi:probable addiction module antidote protein